MNNEQSNIIKISKGLSIALVVIGHTMIPIIREANEIVFNVWTTIYLFHMPVFFVSSGILYELNRNRYEQNPIGFIKRKFHLLIVPYFSLSIIIYIILMALMLLPNVSELIKRYVHELNGVYEIAIEILTYQNHVAQHLWFVLVLFLIFLINILFRKINGKILCWSLIILPIFALPILKRIIWLPDIPDYFLFELPFFMLGRIIGQDNKIKRYVLRLNCTPILFLIMTAVYIVFRYEMESINLPLRSVFLFTTRCLGVFSVFSISSCLVNTCSIKNALLYLEKKSYAIYLLHQPFIVSGGAGVLCYIGVSSSAVIILISLLGIVIPLAIDKLLANMKIYQIFILGGRKN